MKYIKEEIVTALKINKSLNYFIRNYDSEKYLLNTVDDYIDSTLFNNVISKLDYINPHNMYRPLYNRMGMRFVRLINIEGLS